MRCFLLPALLLTASMMWAQTSPPLRPRTTLLSKNIWRATKADRQPFPGSIYIFMPNGTLLETSCGEPYRVARWARDIHNPSMLHITEDQVVVATWTIVDLTPATLQLKKKMTRGGDVEEETLTAVQQEFVCPDLPK